MAISIVTTISPKMELEKLLNKIISHSFLQAENAIIQSADKAVEYMKNFITSHSKRSPKSNGLANAIDYYPFTQTNATMTGTKELECFVGIGKILDLPLYWRIIDVGGFSFAAAFQQGVGGSFDGDAPDNAAAGTNIGGQRFEWNSYNVAGGKGTYVMFPKNEIEGKHYKAATITFLNKELLNAVRQAINLAGIK